MRRLLCSLSIAVAVLTLPALAEPGATIAAAALHDAPGPYPAIATLPAGTKLDVGVCFNDGTFCYVDAAGTTGYVESRLIEVAEGRMDRVERARLDGLAQPGERPGASPMIAAWGDSLTSGAGIAAGDTYTAQARVLFGFSRDIDNDGVGGQNSTAIAARMNAIPTLLTLADDEIPASGPVLVLDRSTTGITNQGPRALAGTICGVVGMLEAETTDAGATYSYRFTRGRPGEAVPCPPESLFRFAAGDSLRDRVAWIWAGTNGAAPNRTVADDIAAMVASLGHEHYLVGAILSATDHSAARLEAARATNRALARTYGERFVDLVAILAAAGNGTEEDAADIAAGVAPRSLRADELHLNARGNAVVAKAWHDATLQLGF